jgi:hypothetical protein
VREILITGVQNKSPGANIMRGDEMRYIHQLGVRTDIEDYPFHAGHISVHDSEIG